MSHPPAHTSTTTSTSTPFTPFLQQVAPLYRAVGWEGFALVAIVALMMFSGDRKGKKGDVSTGRQVGPKEIATAEKVARQQLTKPQRNAVTLYIGTPNTPGRFRDFLRRPRTIVVPNAQEGIAVCGAPGKGKTFSVIDRLACSVADQGFPAAVFDFKGEQIRRLLPYFADCGYECYVLAPGMSYSDGLNPVEFLRSSHDVSMAEQLGTTLNRNFSQGMRDTSNKTFTEASDAVIQSLLLMAKGSIYPDLLMAIAVLTIPNLAKRMLEAQKQGWMDLYADFLSTALTTVADAPETSSGVTWGAFTSLRRLVNPDFISSLCGKSTIPLELKGKRVIFFQLDKRTQDAIAPVMAAVIDLVLSYNLSYRREEPLVYIADEFPILYQPKVFKLIATERENGFVPIIGYQFDPQVKNRYGEDMTRILVGSCATKFIFNPQESGTAKSFMDYFGEEDVFLKTFSRTHGKHASTSRSEQHHRKAVYSMRDILSLPKGHCIFVNPAYEGKGYGGQKEAGLPWRLKVRVPKSDIEAKERSEKLWDEKVRQRLINRAQRSRKPLSEEQLRGELVDRRDLADSLFPVLVPEAAAA